jgi:YesN/AraC family two-component response regulator
MPHWLIHEVLEDKDMMNKYLTLYSNLGDSINKAQKNVDVPLKQIMSDNEEVHNKEIDNLLMIGAGILALLVLLSFIFWKIQKRILHKKYASLIEKLSLKQNAEDQTEQETEQDIKKSVQKQLITDKTTESLLVGLHKFEKSKHFTRKDASLTWLANSLSTNTRTLSEVIKLHKQKSFNDYINGLRINYIMELLYDEPKHREYKISYLAELCGFSSREVFAVIFKKESGISPSYFINNLKKEIDINPLPAKEFHE